MLWKLTLVLSIAFVDVCLASDYFIDNNNYKCKLGSNTPYRCVANLDDSPLKYSGILSLLSYFQYILYSIEVRLYV